MVRQHCQVLVPKKLIPNELIIIYVQFSGIQLQLVFVVPDNLAISEHTYSTGIFFGHFILSIKRQLGDIFVSTKI